jgi:hydrogenase maturation protein HypF
VIERARIVIRGAVQGVGFRPFVYRLAAEMKLCGWVQNTPQGVTLEAQGERAVLDRFVVRLQNDKPARAAIQSLECARLDPRHFDSFEIRPSDTQGTALTLVLPDIATCQDCLRELFDPADRRYLYPFINCTHCGPRFSIIEALPYDRPNTSMKNFSMCAPCRQEYNNPLDRRFHAQPTACPACGPQLEFWDAEGHVLSRRHQAWLDACGALRAGEIVALKGLGGFQLMVDAANERAVSCLRERKHREEKPFALLFPSLASVQAACQVSLLEQRLLLSPEAPIVLLEKKVGTAVASGTAAPSVAPRNPYLGIMLPYTPLHHLITRELTMPVVATSGNLSEEPICIDELEALRRLAGIADYFLVHNRPIMRHVDDSIVRVVMGRELMLRRARGFAPLPLRLARPVPEMLAVGGHLKNSVALAAGENIFLSQHIGDLENREALNAFAHVINSFRRLYRADPDLIVSDLHPDYASSKFAQASGKKVVSIQHHWAHIAGCMAENELEGPVLGVSWDGTGYGLDGTIWGGEFLLADQNSFQRLATFRKFRLPGGEKAVREPRRAALGVLYEIYGGGLHERDDLVSPRSFARNELKLLCRMLEKGVHSPWTTSAGRLFDAVASLINLRQLVTFEGQAAMELEFALPSHALGEPPLPYRFLAGNAAAGQMAAEAEVVAHKAFIVIDWEPMLRGVVTRIQEGKSIGSLSAAFHNTLVEIIVAVAKRFALGKVTLSGGCFQNRYLTEQAVTRLREEGFAPYWHQRVPPNDGGIALGQVAAAASIQREAVSTDSLRRLDRQGR